MTANSSSTPEFRKTSSFTKAKEETGPFLAKISRILGYFYYITNRPIRNIIHQFYLLIYRKQHPLTRNGLMRGALIFYYAMCENRNFLTKSRSFVNKITAISGDFSPSDIVAIAFIYRKLCDLFFSKKTHHFCVFFPDKH